MASTSLIQIQYAKWCIRNYHQPPLVGQYQGYIHNTQQRKQQQSFYGPLSGTTRASRYQKKHSPTHHPDHHIIFISFFCPLRSIAFSLFKLHAWQSFCTTSLYIIFGLPLHLTQDWSKNKTYCTTKNGKIQNMSTMHFNVTNTVVKTKVEADSVESTQHIMKTISRIQYDTHRRPAFSRRRHLRHERQQQPEPQDNLTVSPHRMYTVSQKTALI